MLICLWKCGLWQVLHSLVQVLSQYSLVELTDEAEWVSLAIETPPPEGSWHFQQAMFQGVLSMFPPEDWFNTFSSWQLPQPAP
jgi:hypothetical protein